MAVDDRSIKIPVELDDKQAQKELNRLENNIRKAQDALDKKTTKRDGITAQLEEATRKASELQAKLDELNAAKEGASSRRSKLSDDITEAQAASDNAKSRVERLNTEIETARNNAKRAARELGMMEETAAKDPNTMLSATGRAAILDARAGLEGQRQKVSELNAEYERLVAEQERQKATIQSATAEAGRLRTELSTVPTDESFSAPIKETQAALKEATSEVKRRQTEEARVNQQILEEEANIRRMTGQYNTVNAQLQQQGANSWSQMGQQAQAAMSTVSASLKKSMKTMLKYGLGIRSMYILFRKLRTALIEGIKEYANYDAQTKTNLNNLKTALAGLKGSFVTAFAPIVNAVVPWLVTLINWISNAIAAISQFIAILGGKSTYKKAVANIASVGAAAADAGAAAEEAQKNFSGLDELNVFQEDSGSGGGGGGGGGGSGSGIEYIDEAVNQGGTLANIAEFVRANLESVRLLLDEFGFIIGVILLAAGHPALGIAMMLFFGYQGIKEVVTNWEAIKEQLQGAMGAIYAIVAAAFLSIGLILALTGHLGIGIALMALGAADLVAVVVANWGSLNEKLGGAVGTIMTIASGAALAIGLILALTGVSLPLGLGLIVVGAAGLASELVANWSSLSGLLEGKVGDIVAIVSGALLAIGLILALTGVALPLGLGLMAAGAAGLAASAEAKWGLVGQIQEALNNISSAWDSWSQQHPVASTILKYLLGLLTISGVGVIEAKVSLLQSGWTTVSDWVQQKLGPAVNKGIGLAQDAWTTVSEWVKTKAGGAVTQAIGLVRDTWNTISTWATGFLGGTVWQDVSLWRGNAWTYISTWATGFLGGTVWQDVTLWRGGVWTYISKWATGFLGGTVWQDVTLWRGGLWTYVSSWVSGFRGGTVWQDVTLWRGGLWTYVSSWVKGFLGGTVWQDVSLWRGGVWTYVSSWVKGFLGGTVWQNVGLSRDGWSTVAGWVQNFIGGVVDVGVSLYKWGWSSIKSWLGLADGGIVTERGFHLFSGGGAFSKRLVEHWGIPAYASGTSRAHGTLFAAGEAGPEVVGHIGGRTEVLNRSQLAQVMYAAVVAAFQSFGNGIGYAISTVASIANEARSSIDQMRTSVEHIAYVLSSPTLALAGPAVATGTVIPPMLINISEDLEGIKEAVDRLTARIDNLSTDRGDINLSARVRERVLFDMTIEQGKAVKQQTGKNPFDI